MPRMSSFPFLMWKTGRVVDCTFRRCSCIYFCLNAFSTSRGCGDVLLTAKCEVDRCKYFEDLRWFSMAGWGAF